MDQRLFRYYEEELRHLRGMAGEFAKEFPLVAGRLGLEAFECADPYVERLLEGFAFMAARVHLRLDAEFPRFTQHLLEMVYPHYLAPTPSMAVVQLEPDSSEGALAEGFRVPRDTVLRSPLAKGEQTACEFRTAHDVTLWPVELVAAEYTTAVRDMAPGEGLLAQAARAALRLRLRATAGLKFNKLALSELPLYIRGAGELAMHLYEQLCANVIGFVVRPGKSPAAWTEVLPKERIRQVGFDEREALLPYGPRSFHGYRLLHEYFAFPERFMFVELMGLAPVVKRCADTEIEIVVLFDRADLFLRNAVEASNFALFCTPAVNLFPKHADSIHLIDNQHEYHVVADRSAPMDFEVYDVAKVAGIGAGTTAEKEFLPFYSRTNLDVHATRHAYFTLRRDPRILSPRQRTQGTRASYVGSETFLALVDAEAAPFSTDLRQLNLMVLCTNRDLALLLSVGQGRSDFSLQTGAPVAAIRCLSGPTRPRPSRAQGQVAWRLISHLSLNYLSLIDASDGQGATALRDMLMLYGGDVEAPTQLQVEGLKSVASRPVTRRIPAPGPIAFGRGLEVTIAFDEAAFAGSGPFLLGAILDRFFSKYVSINAFTQTVVTTLNRGEIVRWPMRTGQRHLL
jgi:type VI secretion system protein ImpG